MDQWRRYRKEKDGILATECIGMTCLFVVGLLPNLEAAQQERSMLLSDEQKLLGRKEKEVCV
jgi:hypothetical protein